MKKLFLVMLTLMTTFFVYAGTPESTMAEEISVAGENNVLDRIEVDLSEQTYPMFVTVNIPSGTVLGVSGPCHPVTNWSVSGSQLNIILYSRDFMDLDPGMTGYLEISTTDKLYIIEFRCI